MFEYRYKSKIYAVWDSKNLPAWDPYDTYDASPDGLSGKKEGFYFGNWLMPFSLPFKLQTATISPEKYPGCIDQNPFPCTICSFFSPNICPLLQDIKNFELSRKAFLLYQVLIYMPRGGYDDIFDVAQKELLSHGKPLHYKVVTQILSGRYPKISATDRKVHKVLRSNPIYFQETGEGVYQAIKNRKKGEELDVAALNLDY